MSMSETALIDPRKERPVLDDLRAIGIPLQSLWSDTTHIAKLPPQAFRIILHHLQLNYPRKTREGLARKLARREARDVVWDRIVSMYPDEYDDREGRVAEAFAAAIHVMARRTDLDTLIELIRNPKNAESRLLFVRNLARTSSPKAFEVLDELKNEVDLKLEISRVLKRRKAALLIKPKTMN
jgi:hypothetical protein